ncbi:hypothetical protein BBJ28_00014923 [Nothophytophthora sp. Chile5]|nr:hypothetical protein BBJ28_00014923 [Nothophytophthora sp. Chile5]
MAQETPLSAALGLFASTEAPAGLEALLKEEKNKPVVVLSLPQEIGRKQQREQEKLLVPLAFLFRGRDDIVRRDMGMRFQVRTELPNYLSPIDAEELLGDVVAFTTSQRDCVANAANVSSIIWHAFVEAKRAINWAGFYFVRPLANPKETDHAQILILGPFMGKPACSRIRLQSGVCGAAALTKTVQRIADVHQFPGHIACDGASESELVVPVFDKQGEVIALIDLDCPQKNGFSADDERSLVEVARLISEASDWHNVDLPYSQP